MKTKFVVCQMTLLTNSALVGLINGIKVLLATKSHDSEVSKHMQCNTVSITKAFFQNIVKSVILG